MLSIHETETSVDLAMKLFRLRQGINPHVEVNPAWEQLAAHCYHRAILGERGITEQEQCIMQAIRLTVWQSGQIPAPWMKAFPLPYSRPRPSIRMRLRRRILSWYRQLQDAWREFLKRFNDDV